MIVFITGGVKSGKSSFALRAADEIMGERRVFIATAEEIDGEMAEKIARHRMERGNRYQTIEESVDIAAAYKEAVSDLTVQPGVIIDCVPLWLNNLFHYGRDEEWRTMLTTLLDAACSNGTGKLIVVSNETGMGIIPLDPLTRKYSATLGAANTLIASRADIVYLMVAGIPVCIKGTPK